MAGDINMANNSQVGAMGSDSKVEGNTFNQAVSPDARNIDPAKLSEELGALIQAVRDKATSPEEMIMVGKLAEAQVAAKNGDTNKALEALSHTGSNVLSTAKQIEAHAAQEALTLSLPHVATELERAKITPWTFLRSSSMLVEEEQLSANTFRRVWEKLEQYGLCLIRLHGYNPETHVIEVILNHIGFPSNSQNDFSGAIKDIRPSPEGRLNSGNTSSELGFHVDGTQDPKQPAFLAFQYVEGAMLGAESRFADMAGILATFGEAERNEILLTLARSDAATFSKLEESHTSPIFYYSLTGSLMCRIRFDSVIDVHPDCRSAFDRLKARFEDQRYSAMFLPNRGDVVVFDNWRVMHARDEIQGLAHTRHHRRVWIEFPRREHQVDYRMGIRPIPPEVEAEIRRNNQGSTAR